MKRLFFLIVLFCSPSFADELPVNWFEAGKETDIHFHGLSGRWELRYEHRTLDSGTIDARSGMATSKVKIPPLKPGLQMRATFFINGTPNSEALIVSPDPFEDRKAWFDKHPIALYDPMETTIDVFEREDIPFKRLRSFADIEAVEEGVVVIGEAVDFDREKGLAELLFEYAANGGIVFVAAPRGSIPLHFTKPIDTLLMTKNPKHLFPDLPLRGKEYTWDLLASNNQVVIVGEFDERPDADGPTIVDIRFKNTDIHSRNTTSGRIVFDLVPIFRTWESRIESRWYFKSLIETLTRSQP